MSLSTSSSSRGSRDNSSSLVSIATGIFHDVLASVLSPTNYWHKLQMTTLPLLASAIWYYSRTVIKVTDEEQALWIQMWLSQQQKASERVRRLQLFSSSGGIGKGGRGRRVGMIHPAMVRENDEEGDKEEGEEGRFAPPKLDFRPDDGVVTWTFFGWWPISITSGHHGANGRGDPTYPGGDTFGGGRTGGRSGYILTIWLAPSARSIARNILFQGRKLWLAKRAKKTEIWLGTLRRSHGRFKIVTRPSRPLSSVIVEGTTKEKLREDAIHFLNNERWYISKGIPYRRGYLLYGPPGCGKTSLITALAGDLRMPIVLVPLNDRDMDDRALMEVLGDAPKNSIVLIEDIDCALPKETTARTVAAVRDTYGRTPVTLSGLLNAIDGVGAQEGRLLFMTTNHIDRLDDALIRPGRVDVKYHLDKASKEAAGELFDQFFASLAAPQKTILASRRAFLQKVESGKHSFASLQGVFTSAKDDPTKVAAGVDQLVASPCSGQDPTKDSAYDQVMEIEKARKESIEKERRSEESQRQAGKTVVKRLIGNPAHTQHNTQMQQLVFCGCFPTFGSPDKIVTSGILYYEIEIIKSIGSPQFGFSLKGGLSQSEYDTGEGVGDNSSSWAVDGMRGRLWHSGTETEWKGSWVEGSVLGLAANVDTGMMAVSKNGDWSEAGFGLVFCNEAIKKGVFPAFSASSHTIRYYFEGDKNLQYGPPPESVWVSRNKSEEKSVPKKEA